MRQFNDKVTEFTKAVRKAVKDRREFIKAEEARIGMALGPVDEIEEIAEQVAAEKFAGTLADRDYRKQQIDALIEDHFAETGAMPDDTQIERLTDALLCEELTDSTPYKIANTEYPFMNERMFDERAAKNASEVAVDHEQERKITGSRRQRSPYENALSDRKAKAQNKERRRRYNDFVSGKTDGMFTVNISTGAKITHK